MRLELDVLRDAALGRLVGQSIAVDGATIDSRQVGAGQMFVAVRGGRDGHDFVDAAFEAGAVAAVVDHEMEAVSSLIVVDDTVVALAAMGAAARDRLTGQAIGITGSVGKTSVKDLLAAALSAELRTHATRGNFNNELGLPLTLLNAPEDTEVVVTEMGARGVGQIRELCAVARPTIGIVTCVAGVHASEFASIDEIAETKSELVQSLPASGVAVLNADDERVMAMAGVTDASVLTYGSEGDLTAANVELDERLRATFQMHTPDGRIEVRLAVAGRHQVENALAASAAAISCGVSLEGIAAGLAGAGLSAHRMDLRRLASGAVLINDAYNASPMSVSAALRALAALDADRRVAVLGPMAELGAAERDGHLEVGALADELAIPVIAVAADYGTGTPVADLDEAMAALGPLGPRDAVLVKASRSAGLERLAARLINEG